jgi:hypothetical protein
MYFPRNWEFGSALPNFRISGVGGFEPPKPTSVRHYMEVKSYEFKIVAGKTGRDKTT